MSERKTFDQLYAVSDTLRSPYRRNLARHSLDVLKDSGLPFEVLSLETLSLRVNGNFDFWPSTGTWICRDADEQGFNIETMLDYMTGPRPFELSFAAGLFEGWVKECAKKQNEYWQKILEQEEK